MDDPSHESARFRLFDRGSWPEASRVAEILRAETVGGGLLLAAAVAGLLCANSTWSDGYRSLAQFRLGPGTVGLHLSLTEWAGDGLLAIFFFVAGLELKRELVAGDLRNPRRAALPIAAALGGMLVPAAIYLTINLGFDGQARGWAVPTATDIAFALAVLAVVGNSLPRVLRMFLLTLAVVDDLLAIAIIATFYTKTLHVGWLALLVLPLATFAALVQLRIRFWWLLVPLAVLTWAFVHSSGVHATVAGILLGFAVPVARRSPGEGPGLAEHFEHRFRPLSTGIAVPIFAFFAAGVSLSAVGGVSDLARDPVPVGIAVGLLCGKTIGVLGGSYLVHRFTRASLAPGLSWWDVLGLSLLAGVGFTVSLLIGELAFGAQSVDDERVKLAVLLGSLVSAASAAVVLRIRNRFYRRLGNEE